MSINALISTPEGKEAFKSDKTRLADALALSLLGVVSLLKIDSENSAARKLKEEMKGAPVPGDVVANGSWVRNIINLSLEAGLIDRSTATSMLGMVAAFKKRPTHARSMNPAIFKNSVLRPERLRLWLSPKVRNIWDKVTRDAGPLDGAAISSVALDIWALSKLKEYSDITGDFKEAVTRGGYVSKFGVIKKTQEDAKKAKEDEAAAENTPEALARRAEIEKTLEAIRAKREAEKARKKVKNAPVNLPPVSDDADSWIDSKEEAAQAYTKAVEAGDIQGLVSLFKGIHSFNRDDYYREIRRANDDIFWSGASGRARSSAAVSYLLTNTDPKMRQAALAIVDPKDYLDRFILDEILASKKPTQEEKALISLLISKLNEFYPINIDRNKATRLFVSFVDFYDRAHRNTSGSLPVEARNEVVKVLKLLAPNTNLTKEEITKYFEKISMSDVDLAIKKFSDNLPNITKSDWNEAVKKTGKAGASAVSYISRLKGADREKVADNLTRVIFEPDTGHKNIELYRRHIDYGSHYGNIPVVPTPWVGLLTNPTSDAGKNWWYIVDAAAGKNLENFDEAVVPALNKLFELGKKVSLENLITFLELSNNTGRLGNDLYERVMEQWSIFRREALRKIAGISSQEEETPRRPFM